MKITITEKEEGMTLLHMLKSKLSLSTRIITRLKQRETGITVNGERVTVRYILKRGDLLALDLREDPEAIDNVLPTDLPLDILYEDADIVVVNKPPYMPSHPSRGHYDDTLANALAFYYQKQNIPFVCRILTRLDRNTSGVVLLAKNMLSASRLSASLLQGEVEKNYITLLSGTPKNRAGDIRAPIRRAADSIILRTVAEDHREPGAQAAHTRYRTLAENGKYSAILASPVTGRTHQLRVHFSHIGHPIIGDKLYGGDSTLLPRQALHALSLTFRHPTTGLPMTINAPLPSDLTDFIVQNFDKNLAEQISEFTLS
ncbi:MAG: RluA family pseudouridine synthase [Clostridiales bacterium]|nr:RluA family pseudouridine synthase [Clostridiales bacterium]